MNISERRKKSLRESWNSMGEAFKPNAFFYAIMSGFFVMMGAWLSILIVSTALPSLFIGLILPIGLGLLVAILVFVDYVRRMGGGDPRRRL